MVKRLKLLHGWSLPLIAWEVSSEDAATWINSSSSLNPSLVHLSVLPLFFLVSSHFHFGIVHPISVYNGIYPWFCIQFLKS
jgi:hypothetical protein